MWQAQLLHESALLSRPLHAAKAGMLTLAQLACSWCVPGRRKVIWANMREEPVLYINGKPYVVRESTRPFANLEYTGACRCWCSYSSLAHLLPSSCFSVLARGSLQAERQGTACACFACRHQKGWVSKEGSNVGRRLRAILKVESGCILAFTAAVWRRRGRG